MAQRKLLAPSDAALLLGVSPITVSKWARKGLLRAHLTLGGHRRFTYSEIKRFARSRGMTLFPPRETLQPILVVEDDRQFSDFLYEALTASQPGYQVHIANDGFEAGRLLQKYRPQIVLLDLILPGMDGFSVCRRLRTDPETRLIRVIAMTGYYSRENVERILQAGAEVCLEKPFTRSQLLRALDLEDLGMAGEARHPEG
ncbi:MAG: response regulator [Candidatus Thiodiazotropha sp. (ex Epidulcina cf. delphinae)]|nr:response regulator [Candidatus Thiodiazotropha sp. (ex Epidulcina cf. delphinae)]